MQTDLLGGLAKKGWKLSLISPDDKDPVLLEYCQQHQIRLYSFQANKWIWKTPYVLYRSYFLEDIKSNPALFEKHYHEIHVAKHKWKILNVLPYLLICFYYFFQLFPFLRTWYKHIENSFLKSQEAQILLQSIRPDLLVSTYPVSPMEGILLYNACKENISTAIHLLSWDNITSKGHFFALANDYLAWGPVMKMELMEKYKISPEKISVPGVPHFDLHVQNRKMTNGSEALLEIGLVPDQPFIIFGMSSPRFVPNEIDIVEFL